MWSPAELPTGGVLQRVYLTIINLVLIATSFLCFWEIIIDGIFTASQSRQQICGHEKGTEGQGSLAKGDLDFKQKIKSQKNML